MGKTGNWAEFYTTAKKILILPPEKPPLTDLHFPLSKVSLLPHQIVIFI